MTLIGTRLAWIGTDWHGLARIGKDRQIGKFVSERKIDPRLAQDWQGLARIGMDWIGLTKIGEFESEQKIGP